MKFHALLFESLDGLDICLVNQAGNGHATRFIHFATDSMAHILIDFFTAILLNKNCHLGMGKIAVQQAALNLLAGVLNRQTRHGDRTDQRELYAAIAASLAGIGLYGILSYFVGERSKEIGIRMALGARRTQIVGLVARKGLPIITTGLLFGVISAITSIFGDK